MKNMFFFMSEIKKGIFFCINIKPQNTVSSLLCGILSLQGASKIALLAFFFTIFDKHNGNIKSISQTHQDLIIFLQNWTNINLVISNMHKLYNKQICQILMFLLRFC